MLFHGSHFLLEGAKKPRSVRGKASNGMGESPDSSVNRVVFDGGKQNTGAVHFIDSNVHPLFASQFLPIVFQSVFLSKAVKLPFRAIE